MKKNTFDLKAYSLFATTGLLASPLFGDIIYTDVEPDIQLSLAEPHTVLDIDNDGDHDFQFNVGTVETFSGSWTLDFVEIQFVSMQPLNGASINASGIGSYYYMSFAWYNVVNIPENGTIGTSLNWKSYPLFIENSFGYWWSAEPKGMLGGQMHRVPSFGDELFDSTGNFLETSEDFVGLRMNLGGAPHYGWLRLSVNADANLLTIHDYAYNDVPFASILAGDGTPVMCEIPVILSSDAYPTSAKLKWTAVEDADSYQIRYRPVGATGWINKTVAAPKTSKIISGLLCNTEYEWKIRAKCTGDVNSPYSETELFTTGSCKLGEAEQIPLTVFPNPATDLITLQWDETFSGAVAIYVFDLQGKCVIMANGSAPDCTLEISGLPAGTYLVRTEMGTYFASEKIVVQ